MKKWSPWRGREYAKLFSLTLCLMVFGLISMGVESLETGKLSDSNVPFLFAVFSITWAAFFGYAFYIRRRQRDLEREIAELTDRYTKTKNSK
jgi:CcmD family protein